MNKDIIFNATQKSWEAQAERQFKKMLNEIKKLKPIERGNAVNKAYIDYVKSWKRTEKLKIIWLKLNNSLNNTINEKE